MSQFEPHLFVVFGASGDLARRKLLPAFYRLQQREGFGKMCRVLGVARRPWDDATFRAKAAEALIEAGIDPDEVKAWCSQHLSYQQVDGDFEPLADRIAEIEETGGLPGNRVFYLALPPGVFVPTIEGLAVAGLADGPGWRRLVIEKPFGHDLASARALNGAVHQVFDEREVYRIDHYLGKETVQNLLVFRFANALFENAWTRDRIEQVQITVAEEVGVEDRAGYYDSAGATRDMLQSHLAQLLTLTAMEPPARFDADAIRDEKVKVLRSLRPVDPARAVFGQYVAGSIRGEPVPGYADEVGAPSSTETAVAIEVFVDSWRWEGVPFLLRTGKRFPTRRSVIVVTFREPPISLFGPDHAGHARPNVLVLTIQPDEGFELTVDVKTPGDGMDLDTVSFRFSYADEFGEIPDAYETLIADVIIGDQTLFVRSDEVEEAWAVFEPLLADHPDPDGYTAGSWGPAAMASLAGDHAWYPTG